MFQLIEFLTKNLLLYRSRPYTSFKFIQICFFVTIQNSQAVFLSSKATKSGREGRHQEAQGPQSDQWGVSQGP